MWLVVDSRFMDDRTELLLVQEEVQAVLLLLAKGSRVLAAEKLGKLDRNLSRYLGNRTIGHSSPSDARIPSLG